MIAVAFDTATDVLAIGVGRWTPVGMDVLASRDLAAPRSANTRLLPELNDMLCGLSLAAKDVGAVVIGRGPGSFTGVRIGVATAKGLAHGLGVPLFGVGTLDAIARRFAHEEGLVGVVGDAMRAEVYPALFRVGGGRVERLSADEVTSPADIAHRWAAGTEGPLLLAGNAIAKHEAVFAETLGGRAIIAPRGEWSPTGESLLLEAFASCDPEVAPHPGVVLPVYTRLSDAEEAERRRLAESYDGCRVPDSGVAGPESER